MWGSGVRIFTCGARFAVIDWFAFDVQAIGDRLQEVASSAV